MDNASEEMPYDFCMTIYVHGRTLIKDDSRLFTYYLGHTTSPYLVMDTSSDEMRPVLFPMSLMSFVFF